MITVTKERKISGILVNESQPNERKDLKVENVSLVIPGFFPVYLKVMYFQIFVVSAHSGSCSLVTSTGCLHIYNTFRLLKLSMYLLVITS